MNPAQTSQDKGANSSTAQCCVRLGRVPRSCSRRHTSMAHEEATLQRCRSAAAVEVACSPLKTCLQSYLQSRRLGGAPSREDPRRKKSSMRAEASAGLDKLCTRAARAGVRSLYLYGNCFPTAASKRKCDGRHQGGQSIEEREGLYIHRNINSTSPSAPLIPPIALPMASSKNDHTRANIAGLTYYKGRPKFLVLVACGFGDRFRKSIKSVRRTG